jgi:hypothetical protein
MMSTIKREKDEKFPVMKEQDDGVIANDNGNKRALIPLFMSNNHDDIVGFMYRGDWNSGIVWSTMGDSYHLYCRYYN